MVDQMKIATRKTQRGDWLVFEAVPAKAGVGVERVGNPLPGYTTGLQFSRFQTEEEAGAYAGELAVKIGGEVVDWLAPGTNRQFADLPRLFPAETEYGTVDEAATAGWLYIAPGKTIERHRGVKIACADVSTGQSFGYDLAIVAGGRRFLESTTVWTGGKFSPRFRTGEVVEAISQAREFIADDLLR
jgi:hypothetical protein